MNRRGFLGMLGALAVWRVAPEPSVQWTSFVDNGTPPLVPMPSREAYALTNARLKKNFSDAELDAAQRRWEMFKEHYIQVGDVLEEGGRRSIVVRVSK